MHDLSMVVCDGTLRHPNGASAAAWEMNGHLPNFGQRPDLLTLIYGERDCPKLLGTISY